MLDDAMVALNWPEVIGHLQTVDNLPVHLSIQGALRPLTDLRRCGSRICAQAGSYEHCPLTTDAAATLWRAFEQMATGNHTYAAFGLVDDVIAPITGLWLVRPDHGSAERVVALTCATLSTRAMALASAARLSAGARHGM